MRRYATNAAPDDPGVWSDVSGLFPTDRGSYISCDSKTSLDVAATGETGIKHAYCAKTLTGSRCFVIGAKIWEYSGGLAGSFTDRTNAMAIGANPHMVQYGNVTICAMGAAAGTPTIVSTSTTFAALGGGSPAAEIAVTINGVVLLFNYYDGANTYNDGWWASDVGDYTTWTPASSNDAANARLLDTNGPVTAAGVLGDHVYAFKTDAIYRGTYVGGQVKWQWELVERGIGAKNKYLICECGDRIAYVADNYGPKSGETYRIMLFDGTRSVCINEDVAFPALTVPHRMVYDAAQQILLVSTAVSAGLDRTYAYNLKTGAWGRTGARYGYYDEEFPASEETALMTAGDAGALTTHFGATIAGLYKTIFWYCESTTTPDYINLTYPVAVASAVTGPVSYVQTSKMGTAPDRKTLFKRCVPLLRYRANISGATPSAALAVNYYKEMHDTAAASTGSASEASSRNRFDFMGANTYADFKVTYTGIAVEIDDLKIVVEDAGTD